MAKLPGTLVYAQHLRMECRVPDAVEIMLRREPNKLAPYGWEYVIYLDGREVDRVLDAPGVAYDRMDAIAGYDLGKDRGVDLESSLSR